MPRKRLPVLLRRAWYGLNQSFRDRIEHLGITPNQFSILRWLSEGDPEGLSQRTLARLMASDDNTMSSTLARMEKAGLIVRVTYEEDRRASRVRLLPAAQRKLEDARPVAFDHQDRALSALSKRQQARFLADLELIANACVSAEKGGRPWVGAGREKNRRLRKDSAKESSSEGINGA
jgi:MarR family transcriptional regulator for hemolysin